MAFSFGNISSTKHKIIIGIDYGTTFSGVSYVTTDKSDIKDINIISSWPGPGDKHGRWKTPTRIAYARENPTISKDKWGFEVDPKLTSYSWTKLLLDKNAAVGEHDDPGLAGLVGSGMLQLPSFRLAGGVCEDFLHEVYVHVSKKLREQMTNVGFETTPMECWITLPAIWGDEAKNLTLMAAKKAGFGNRAGDEVFTIAEPEAAAIATLKEYSLPDAMNALKVNENILICDCGGGTVDITTYVITQVTPRLEFEELLTGVGGKCGSTYIDRNLHALLSNRFGTKFDDLAPTQKGPGSKLMKSFEDYKRDFGLGDESDILEIGPVRMDVPDSDFFDEEECMVKLTHEDMQTLFDPVVSEITSLVNQQVKEARLKKNANIDRIILVGGFAESSYLYNALGEWCWKHGNIMLIRPEHPQAAVLRGAALRGLEGISPRVKHVRRHYGISVGEPFREGIDPEEESYIDGLYEKKWCRSRMTWLISKGDEIVEGTFRTVSCMREYEPGSVNICQLALYSCSLANAPEYRTHTRVDKIGVIKHTFGADDDYGPDITSKYNHRLRKVIHDFSYKVQVVFGSKGSNLIFKILVRGKVVATADIEFDPK